MSRSVVFLLHGSRIFGHEHRKVDIGFLLVHLMRCRWSWVREWDIMAAIVITKVDMFSFRVRHSVVVRLAMLIMRWQIVERLIDDTVAAWHLQRLSPGFCEYDLSLLLSRYTRTVRSNSEVALHLIANDGPLGVLDGLFVATKEMIGEERFVLFSHLISEQRRN